MLIKKGHLGDVKWCMSCIDMYTSFRQTHMAFLSEALSLQRRAARWRTSLRSHHFSKAHDPAGLEAWGNMLGPAFHDSEGAVSHWWVFHWWYFSMLYNVQWDCSCIRWICQQLSDSKHFCCNLSATSGRPFSSQFSADTLTDLYGKQGSYSEQDCWDPIYTIRIIYTMSIWSKHVKAKSVASRNDVMSQVSASDFSICFIPTAISAVHTIRDLHNIFHLMQVAVHLQKEKHLHQVWFSLWRSVAKPVISRYIQRVWVRYISFCLPAEHCIFATSQ